MLSLGVTTTLKLAIILRTMEKITHKVYRIATLSFGPYYIWALKGSIDAMATEMPLSPSDLLDLPRLKGEDYVQLQNIIILEKDLPDAARCSHVKAGIQCPPSIPCYLRQMDSDHSYFEDMQQYMIKQKEPEEDEVVLAIPLRWQGDTRGPKVYLGEGGKDWLVCIEGWNSEHSLTRPPRAEAEFSIGNNVSNTRKKRLSMLWTNLKRSNKKLA
jgi:hypothetical protein